MRPFAKSVVSRKTHGSAGTFDINLPTACTYGIECRTEGPGGIHHIVFSFVGPVSINGATVTSSPGGTAELDGAPVMNPDNTGVTVNLKNVSNAQQISVALNGVNDGTSVGDVALMMVVLLGDTSGNGLVNSTDISQTQAQSGQVVTGSNFRKDVNANGLINSTDVSSVQAKSGTGLP